MKVIIIRRRRPQTSLEKRDSFFVYLKRNSGKCEVWQTESLVQSVPEIAAVWNIRLVTPWPWISIWLLTWSPNPVQTLAKGWGYVAQIAAVPLGPNTCRLPPSKFSMASVEDGCQQRALSPKQIISFFSKAKMSMRVSFSFLFCLHATTITKWTKLVVAAVEYHLCIS